MKDTEAIDHTKVVLDEYARAVKAMMHAQKNYLKRMTPYNRSVSNARETRVNEMTETIINNATKTI